MTANADMAAAWDGPEGEAWAAHAGSFERVGRRHWRRFTDAVPVARDARVLDVGCGTGRSSRDVARLASDGEVLGVDLSRPMLAHAREAAREEGLANVTFVHADAQTHPFDPGTYDLAISLYGAMFFDDPVAAFANIGHALRPGGRLALMAWRELRHNEWLLAVRDALAAGRVLPTPPAGLPGPFGLADAEHVRRVLTEAGYGDVGVEQVDEPVDFGADAEEAYAFVSDLGITRGLLGDLDDETRAKAMEGLRRVVDEHATPDGVLFGSSSWLVTAERSGL
jgi:SAM-dependent methyltransferase